MKILWFTDIHLSLKDKLGVIDASGTNSRLREKTLFLQHIVTVAKREKVTCIIDGGDIFDLRSAAIPAELREIYIKNFILPLIDTAISVRIIGTNHGSDGDFNALGAEAHLFTKNIKLITEVRREPADNKNVFWYIPYGYEIPASVYETPETSVIFGHFTIAGLYPDPKAIQIDHTRIKMAIIGHLHQHRVLGNGKLFYTGSSFPNAFDEVDQFGAKFYIFDTEAEDLLPELDHYEDIRPVQYFKIPISEVDTLPIKKDALVKIKLVGKKGEISRISEALIKEKYPQAVNIIIEYDITQEAEEISTTSGDFTPEQILAGITALTDKSEYLDYGLNQIETARELLK